MDDPPEWLISRLATITEESKPTTSSTEPSSSQTSTSDASIHTFTSVQEGRTVFVTVTEQPAPTEAVTAPNATSNEEYSKGNSKLAGPVAGGVVGGVALLAIAFFSLYLFLRYRDRKRTKERDEATLPPPYSATDMSGQLRRSKWHNWTHRWLCVTDAITGGTTATAVSTDSADPTSDEKAGLASAVEDHHDPDPVPNLDSAMLRPTLELGEGPLGSIPELGTCSRTALNIPLPPSPTVQPEQPDRRRTSGDSDNHVMSWTQLSHESSRGATSRLAQPHNGPDHTVAVWENMAAPHKDKPEGLKSDSST
jgi:hypothetical protein